MCCVPLLPRRFLALRLIVLSAAFAAVTGWAAPASGANLGASSATAPTPALKIVLIGGKKSHGPGMHDFPNGIPAIAALLRAAPAFAGAEILTYTTGFPEDLSVLRDASTIVLYFDGVMEQPPPLLAAARIAALQAAMDAGAGLIALHQASTLPAGDQTVPLSAWLGAKRDGMYDRTTETTVVSPVDPTHPIAAGVGPVEYQDEFYPTLVFARSLGRVTPILHAALTPSSGEAIAANAPLPARADFAVAWAFERPSGGRAFGYTGLHYVSALELRPIRQLLLNAIAWTARMPVPAGGIKWTEPVVAVSAVTRAADNKVLPNAWGELRWYTSAEMGNSRTMTTGVARLAPGQANPRHFHPNCDEILHVVSGRIRHTMNEATVELGAGDTISIPQGVVHNATNIGSDEAVLAISFSSAYRQAVGYDGK